MMANCPIVNVLMNAISDPLVRYFNYCRLERTTTLIDIFPAKS